MDVSESIFVVDPPKRRGDSAGHFSRVSNQRAEMNAVIISTGRHPAPQIFQNFVPLEGYRVFKFNSSLLAIFLLSGCSSDLVLSPPKQPDYKPMPDITQSVTPTQQRAIMAGERPDWSERTQVSAAKRY